MANDKSATLQVYFDTNFISGCVKNDLNTTDLIAIEKIVQIALDGGLIISASTVAREELEKIPKPFRDKHIEMYKTLNILKGAVTTWIDDDPLSTSYGKSFQDEDFVELQEILPHKNDARHLFQAKKAGVPDIITSDYNSILIKRKELESQCGLRVYSLSGYLETIST